MSCFCFDLSSGTSVRTNNVSNGDDRDTLVEVSELSHPSPQGSFPDIPISYKDLRKELRVGLMPEARLFWWPILPRVLPKSTIKKDPNVKRIATSLFLKTKAMLPETRERLRTQSNLQCLSHTVLAETLKSLYADRVEELLNMIFVLYDIPEPGLLYPFLGALVLIIPSIDLCLQLCFDILNRKEWFISLTSEDHRLCLISFRKLLKKNFSDEYSVLDESGALHDECLNLIFVDFFQTILPFENVVRVLDCYVLEGQQVLFNLGLGIIYLNRDLLETSLLSKGYVRIQMCNYISITYTIRDLSDEMHSFYINRGKIQNFHPFWEEVRRRCYSGDISFTDIARVSFTDEK